MSPTVHFLLPLAVVHRPAAGQAAAGQAAAGQAAAGRRVAGQVAARKLLAGARQLPAVRRSVPAASRQGSGCFRRCERQRCSQTKRDDDRYEAF